VQTVPILLGVGDAGCADEGEHCRCQQKPLP
jgi:hypothetical protein